MINAKSISKVSSAMPFYASKVTDVLSEYLGDEMNRRDAFMSGCKKNATEKNTTKGWLLGFAGGSSLLRFGLLAAVVVLFTHGCAPGTESPAEESPGAEAPAAEMERIRVAEDQRSFVLAESGETFVPWGFNYDHDREGRLIEDYWREEWATVEEDFREMKRLGANVVRIHLQFGKFMKGPDTPNEQALARLEKLLALAERTGLYLDLTGLGSYHKQDVPAWYDQMSEDERWEAQARFWEAVAARGTSSPAVFCYDLMNEPIALGGEAKREDWLGPALGKKHFVQFITLEARGRPKEEIARQWIEQMVAAIREHDPRHLVTVGLVPWSVEGSGMYSGFSPGKVTGRLDFIAMHLYPESGKVDEAIETLKGFDVGKPLVIEETFPLKSSLEEFGAFLKRTRPIADGWIGFYWGKTPAEYRADEGKNAAAVMLGWLELFQERSGVARPGR